MGRVDGSQAGQWVGPWSSGGVGPLTSLQMSADRSLGADEPLKPA